MPGIAVDRFAIDPPAGSRLNAGDVITVTMTPSTAVEVTPSGAGGLPALELSNGTSAVYDAGRSGPLAMVFTRTVQTGEDTDDLAVTGFDPRGAGIGPAGASGLYAPQRSVAAGNQPISLAMADLDADGRTDLVATNYLEQRVSVLPGNGDGTFRTGQTYAVPGLPTDLAAVDLNRDGRQDLAVSHVENFSDPSVYNAGVTVLLGGGDGSFQAPRTVPVTGTPRALAAADLDRDGVQDLATANGDGRSVSVLLGAGDGTFQAQQNFAVPATPLDVAAADVDGDGDADLVTAHSNQPGVTVLLGGGDGSFQALPVLPLAGQLLAVAAADLDGDGALDLAVVDSSGGNVSVLLGNGDGTFRARQAFDVGYGPHDVAAADVDGDGDLDLAAANYGSGTSSSSGSVSVLLNQTARAVFDPGAVVGYETGLVIDTAAPGITVRGLITNAGTPTLRGGAESGAAVAVTLDGGAIGTKTQAAGGAWSVVPGAPLAAGTYTVGAEATDAAGNGAAAAGDGLVVLPAPVDGVTAVDRAFYDVRSGFGAGYDTQFAPGTEALRFLDGEVSVGVDTAGAYLSRLYLGLLGRGSDARGIGHWSDAFDGGQSRAEVARGFLEGAEFASRPGDRGTDRAFVSGLYDTVLRRGGEVADGEIEGWTGAMARGAPRADVAAAFADSPEAKEFWRAETAGDWVPDPRAQFVAVTYETALGRAPEAAGLAAWVDAMRNGLTPAEVAAGFVGAAEFRDKHRGLNDAEVLGRFYENGLDRAPAPSELDAALARIGQGASTLALELAQVAQSDEAHGRLYWGL